MVEFFLHSFNNMSHMLVGYVIPFLFVLTVVVFFHELGHFLVARWAGVKVLTFSLGFGPELAGFNDRRGTRWKISAVPLGGYVKFLGDDTEASTPSVDALAKMTEQERAESFHHKKVGPRAAIVAAGPIANFILAVLIFAGIALYYGKPASIARADAIVPGSAAASAGFMVGDVVKSIDGTSIESFADMQRIVSTNAGSSLVFKVQRDGNVVTLTAVPELKEDKDLFGNRYRTGRLGIQYNPKPNDPTSEPVGFVESLKIGVDQVWFIIAITLKTIFKLLAAPFIGGATTDDLGGPLRIAQLSGQAASLGFHFVLQLCAGLSVSIGLLNLLPVPLLDGGHLLFYTAEVVRGRPLSERAQEMGFRLGLGLILMLMVFVTYKDILRFWA
jgi:regulator of sigma E protease